MPLIVNTPATAAGEIPDGSITTAKLAEGAVTPAKLDRAYAATTAAVAAVNVSSIEQVAVLPDVGVAVAGRLYLVEEDQP